MSSLDIRAFGTSVQGTAHIEAGVVCQDAHKHMRLPNDWYVVIVADGIGSATHSDEGSQTAVNAAAQWMYFHAPIVQWDVTVLKDVWLNAFRSAQLAVATHAQARQLPETAFDTTLTGFIYNGQQVIYAHSGDGGIVVLQNDGRYRLLTEAQKGDEASSTYVLRLGEHSWEFGHSSDPVAAVAAMTDGVLAAFCPARYSLTGEPVSAKFATQFMHLQRSDGLCEVATAVDFEDRMTKGIKAYLQSDKVAAITDDKTLVVAINMNVASSNIGDTYYDGSDRDEAAIDRKIREGLYSSNAPAPAASMPQREVPVQDNSQVSHAAVDQSQSFAPELSSQPEKKSAVVRYIVIVAVTILLSVGITFAVVTLTWDDYEEEMLDLQEQAEQLQAENDALEKQLDDADVNSNRLNREMGDLQDEIRGLQDQLGSLEASPTAHGYPFYGGTTQEEQAGR